MENKSHPIWVRGLKQTPYGKEQGDAHVAPYMGAWIETFYKRLVNLCV